MPGIVYYHTTVQRLLLLVRLQLAHLLFVLSQQPNMVH
jgi:hypothetical protein